MNVGNTKLVCPICSGFTNAAPYKGLIGNVRWNEKDYKLLLVPTGEWETEIEVYNNDRLLGAFTVVQKPYTTHVVASHQMPAEIWGMMGELIKLAYSVERVKNDCDQHDYSFLMTGR